MTDGTDRAFPEACLGGGFVRWRDRVDERLAKLEEGQHSHDPEQGRRTFMGRGLAERVIGAERQRDEALKRIGDLEAELERETQRANRFVYDLREARRQISRVVATTRGRPLRDGEGGVVEVNTVTVKREAP